VLKVEATFFVAEPRHGRDATDIGFVAVCGVTRLISQQVDRTTRLEPLVSED